MTTEPRNMNTPGSGATNTTQIVQVSENTYLVTESDGGRILSFDNGASASVQLSNNVGTGFSVRILQAGAGEVSFFGVPGIVIRSRDGRNNLAGQYACAEATCIGPGEWLICGDVVSGG